MGKKRKKKMRIIPPSGTIEYLFIRDEGRCWICKGYGLIHEFNRDHVIPKALGGPDGLWNIRLAHKICNQERHTKQPPLYVVLKYCTNPDMRQKAKRLYRRAYPSKEDCDEMGLASSP